MYRKSLKAIIAVLALAYAFEASADAYSRISLSEANTPIDEVLKKIEKEAQCLFVINTQVDTKRKVNLNVQNKTVSEILDIMFKGTDVSYSIQNPNIMLSKKAASAQGNVASASAMAQSANTKIITGNVTDASGETLIGLTVKACRRKASAVRCWAERPRCSRCAEAAVLLQSAPGWPAGSPGALPRLWQSASRLPPWEPHPRSCPARPAPGH